MNLYHIKLTDDQKAALEHLFSQDITWNKTELEKAWNELREQVREAAQHVAIINALQDSGCNCNRKTPTKYDPCRLFKKGDKVQIVMNKGRHFDADAERMYLCKGIVTFDETRGDYIAVSLTFGNSEEDIDIDPAYLELVTPVEELEPYFIEEGGNGYRLMKRNGKLLANYWETHPNAKAATEAERDRLNAEHREEMER